MYQMKRTWNGSTRYLMIMGSAAMNDQGVKRRSFCSSVKHAKSSIRFQNEFSMSCGSLRRGAGALRARLHRSPLHSKPPPGSHLYLSYAGCWNNPAQAMPCFRCWLARSRGSGAATSGAREGTRRDRGQRMCMTTVAGKDMCNGRPAMAGQPSSAPRKAGSRLTFVTASRWQQGIRQTGCRAPLLAQLWLPTALAPCSGLSVAASAYSSAASGPVERSRSGGGLPQAAPRH